MSERPEMLESPADKGRRGGPRTAVGLAAASKNSLQHGLTGSGIHLPAGLRDEVVRWSASFERRYEPIGEEAAERVEQAALAFAQYRGAISEQTRYLVRRSEDAVLNWDERRIAEAEQLACKLSNRPGPVSSALRATFRGAEWLLKRWNVLRSALETKGDWNEEELALAMDLLGIDPIERPYDPAGIASATADARKAVVEEQCRGLEERVSGDFVRFEEFTRDGEIEGKGYLLDKVYLKLERYARDAYRRYEKHIAYLDAHCKARPKEHREATEPVKAAPKAPEIAMPAAVPPAPIGNPAQAIQRSMVQPIVDPKPIQDGNDRGRELRADPPRQAPIARPKVHANRQQRRRMQAALQKAAGSKPPTPSPGVQ